MAPKTRELNVWRFVELGRRLDFLLAGLGWGQMPKDLVKPLLAEERLRPLPIEDDPASAHGPLTIYAAHMRDRPLGRAGAWLLDNLRARFIPISAQPSPDADRANPAHR